MLTPFTPERLSLYAVTDRAWLGSRTLCGCVEQALQGGVTFLQLREKELAYPDFLEEAIQLKALASRYHVPLVINDQVRLALEAGADGVHVGQKDMGAKEARRLIGPGRILGVSARTEEQALRAQEEGADYLGVGSVFPTSTKADASSISILELKKICQAVDIPVVAIGGITPQNMGLLSGSGIAGIAVVSALFAQDDIRRAAEELRNRW